MWTVVLITATEWENFFKQRCPKYEYKDGVYRSRKDVLRKTFEESQVLKGREAVQKMGTFGFFTELDWLKMNKGQADIHMMKVAELIYDALNESTPYELEEGQFHIPYHEEIDEVNTHRLVKASVGRCARASYITIGDESDYTPDKLIKIHDKLLEADPIHASPFEHVAYAKTEERLAKNPQCRNFTGWIQYREIIESGERY